ncbi:MAG: hypothetical protein AAGK14_06980 [Verrucomicrobiota bacterium]
MATTTPQKPVNPPVPKTPLDPVERKELIFRRRRESLFWAAVAIFGSVKFAVVLLVTIAVVVGAATIVESVYDTPVALYYIYNATFFILFLALLCVNLAAAALSRWPWQRKHTGFVVTHMGIITLLIGSMIGMIWGFEGYVTLHTDGPARDQLFAGKTLLKVQSAADGGIDQMDFPVDAYGPTPEAPLNMELPGTDLQLVVSGYSEQLQRQPVVEPSIAPLAPVGLDLAMSSGMMNQELELPFLVDLGEVLTQPLFTMAKIEIHPSFGPEEEIGRPAPVDFPNLPPEALFREMHVVLAQHADQPVITTDLGRASGYRFTFEENRNDPRGFDLIMTGPGGAAERWPLSDLLGKATLAANGSLQVVVPEYWPDFDISSGRPVSKSDEPNNPGVRIELFGARASMEPPKPTLQLTPTEDRAAIAYRLLRENQVVGSGELREGETLPLGWADWQLTLRRLLPQAQMGSVTEESAGALNLDPAAGGGQPMMRGIRAHLAAPDGRATEPAWLLGGITHPLYLDGRPVQVWFGPEIIPLHFDVKLESFSVPRDPGTDTPADFISQLVFTDREAGTTARGEAHMNTPALYPDSFWRAVTGQTYKFSQAGWNRHDLTESRLQVLYDPGWLLKWVGSLGICVGIFMLFYMKGYGREARAVDREAQTAAMENKQ